MKFNQHDKGYLLKTNKRANMIPNGKRLKTFLPRSGRRLECTLSPMLLNAVLEVLPKKSDKKKK